MTTEEFVQKAKEKWGDKFDYTKTVYTGWNKELIITCSEHGDYVCIPYNHLRSKYGGCQKCNPKKQITQEEFIQEVNKKFPEYDYSNTIYINSYTNVKTICKKHGEFESYPRSLLLYGCPKCSPRKVQNLNKEKTKNNFINKANQIHNNKYDYSLVDYINSKTKVKIICPEHGVFEQMPYCHISGQGCPVCGKLSGIKSRTKTKEQFIKEANLIHNNKYDYSKVDYVNFFTPVKIICYEHGIFEQKPEKHLSGQGCPKCAGRNRTTEEAIKDIESVYPSVYDLSKFEYINATTDSLICCKKHNYWFKDNYHKLMTNTSRKCCDMEWQSNPNIYIKDLLDKYKIKNFSEYKFSDCKNVNKLSFDFYLPDYNTVIEYQGEWHYNNYRNNLELQQKRDQIKRDYCKKKGIKEIEIPYWDFDKIESIIKLIL